MNKSNKKSTREMSILPGAEVGVRVVKTKRRPNGDIELALRSLKKELKVSGKMQRLKDNRYFISKKTIQRNQILRPHRTSKFLCKKAQRRSSL